MLITKKLVSRLENNLRIKINNLHSIFSILDGDFDGLNRVFYTYISYSNDGSPNFNSSYIDMDLRDINRDLLLSDVFEWGNDNNKLGSELELDRGLLKSSEVEHLLKLDLEDSRFISCSSQVAITCLRQDWASKFSIGDRVKFRGKLGVITFKHTIKDGGIQDWSVKVGGCEWRYVPGDKLVLTGKENLSYIDVSGLEYKRLDKLSTERLLKMYRRSLKVSRGRGNKLIKRILYDRENLSNNKIVEVIDYRDWISDYHEF